MWFLLSVYHFHSIIKSKNCKVNPHELGTDCINMSSWLSPGGRLVSGRRADAAGEALLLVREAYGRGGHRAEGVISQVCPFP